MKLREVKVCLHANSYPVSIITTIMKYVITGRNEVLAKVIFLHLFVILFTGGGVPDQVHPPGPGTPPDQVHLPCPPRAGTPPGIRYTPPGPGTPPGLQTPEYGQRSAGMHGMHSCLYCHHNYSHCRHWHNTKL